ncbi:hypothetical protein NDU88_003610 [Pleurodeles waltl]|uniref:Uncharacterized protein n=1 Tax=Pleurodeles waltl TaxID=8319 RepID=A0AAV7MSB9_PLEWA|nr:hypothetical protein NDU88_003610 [Pleurodeles waltl]
MIWHTFLGVVDVHASCPRGYRKKERNSRSRCKLFNVRKMANRDRIIGRGYSSVAFKRKRRQEQIEEDKSQQEALLTFMRRGMHNEKESNLNTAVFHFQNHEPQNPQVQHQAPTATSVLIQYNNKEVKSILGQDHKYITTTTASIVSNFENSDQEHVQQLTKGPVSRLQEQEWRTSS